MAKILKVFAVPEDEINFDSFTKVSIFILRLFSIDLKPLSKNASFIEKLADWRKFIQFAVFLCLTYVTEIITFLIYAWQHMEEDFVASARCILDSLSVMLLLLLGVEINRNKNEVWNIIGEMRELFDRRIDKNKKYKVQEYFIINNRIIKCYMVAYVIFATPIISGIFFFFIYGTMQLQAQNWYPFDPYTPENYVYAWTWTLWILIVNLVFLLGADSLQFSLITTLAMEFDVLNTDFTEMKSYGKSEIQKKMKELVDRHNKLFAIGEKLQNVYELSFLYGVAVSSLIMCFVAFQLTTAHLDIGVLLYVGYFVIFGGRQFLICLHGQLLIDSSAAISHALYNCGWEEMNDAVFKKSLTLVILRAERPFKLTAMQFADISREAFAQVSFPM